MRALGVVVVGELTEQPLGVALAEHDHVVQALAAEGADQALRVSAQGEGDLEPTRTLDSSLEGRRSANRAVGTVRPGIFYPSPLYSTRTMNRLSDFKPLGRVLLPELGDLRCSGLVVIVGPNSSGKSQLLQDLYRRLIGEPRQLVVAQEVRVEKPPYEPFMQCLEREGYFGTFEDEAGNKQLRPRTMFLGSGQAAQQINPQQAQQWHGSFSPETHMSPRRQSEFLNYFGRLLVTGLFLDRRLTSLNPAGLIDFLVQPPQHDLHALHLDDRARSLLLDESRASFGRSVWPDMSRGNQMSLKVSDEGYVPSPEDRLSHKKMAEFRSIDTEGDGMKSYLATCVALLLGQRPVCIIDEPELCLHPPQAYNLGRFIGRFGASTDTATFVATHSSHLLRGIVQTAKDVQIVRLTRRGREFVAHLVPATDLSEALSRPTLRAEAVLDGIFAQAVLVTEADGDRLVYQAAWETVQADRNIDVHFATVGGTGGIADTARLYRSLRIPIAVVADLDMLVNRDRMRAVLEVLAPVESREKLAERCSALGEAIRRLPPEKEPKALAVELTAIASEPMDWTKGHDLKIRKRLSMLVNGLDRMRKLKRGGSAQYSGTIGDAMRSVLAELEGFGLFLVPVGELEEWLGNYSVPAPKANKRLWANAAAQRIQELGKQCDDIWAFITRVGDYLLEQRAGSAHSGLRADAK